MAARAVRDGHGVNHGQLVVLPKIAKRRQTWRKPERVVECDQVGLIERERTTQRAVRRVAVRHDGGETIEAAPQEHEDETPALLHLGEVDDREPERRDAAEAHVSDEAAAIHGYLH